MSAVEDNIIGILKQHKVDYDVVEHEPVYTNPTMAVALGVGESETVKSLVLMTREKEMVVLVLPGDKKVDWKKRPLASAPRKSPLPKRKRSWKR